jgi:hypothetical protein
MDAHTRVYSVLLMYYDPRSKTPVAFRRSIDDDPDDPDDDKAFPWVALRRGGARSQI